MRSSHRNIIRLFNNPKQFRRSNHIKSSNIDPDPEALPKVTHSALTQPINPPESDPDKKLPRSVVKQQHPQPLSHTTPEGPSTPKSPLWRMEPECRPGSRVAELGRLKIRTGCVVIDSRAHAGSGPRTPARGERPPRAPPPPKAKVKGRQPTGWGARALGAPVLRGLRRRALSLVKVKFVHLSLSLHILSCVCFGDFH